MCDAFCEEECDSVFDIWLLTASVPQHTPFFSYPTSGETKVPSFEAKRGVGFQATQGPVCSWEFLPHLHSLKPGKPHTTPLT